MTSWSYSQYSTAIKCLREYKLCYIDKLVPPDEEPSADMAFGTSLHTAIHAEMQGDNGTEVFDLSWEIRKDEALTYGRFGWEELNRLGHSFMAKLKKGHGKHMSLDMGEKRLYATYKGISLEGTPDFIGEYDNEVALLDYKTSAYNYHKDRARSSLQLHLYAYLAIQNGQPEPKSVGYLVFNKTAGSIQYQTWPFDRSLMYSMLDNLVDYVNMIESQASYPKNPNGCMMGMTQCRYFKTCWM